MADRPNVLVILCDQMRPFEVGCYGHPVVQTPHIDALAAEGVRFEHGLSNNPVCVPARSILLSGQYSRTCTGSLWNHAPWWPPTPERRRLRDHTLPECLRDAGYATHHIGKWHVDPDPLAVGFDHSLSAVRIGSRATFSENGAEPFEVPMFSEDYQLHRLDELLSDGGSVPFFCYYNIYWPHMPLAHMPLRYQRMYAPEQVLLRDNVPQGDELPFDERWFHVYLWEHAQSQDGPGPCTDRLPADFDLRDLTALYYGAISWVDDLVGEIRARLERSGMLDDTIVMFLSDHGDNLGSHNMWNKDRFWEESIRIPYIMRGPGITQGLTNVSEQAQLIDVMPTLLDLCDVTIPDTVQGGSLAPVLSGARTDLGRPAAFIETGSYECVARTTGAKFVRRIPRPGPPIRPWLVSAEDHIDRFYYDLTADPCETSNLADAAGVRDQAMSLDLAVTEWDEQTPWLDLEQTAAGR